MRVRRRGQVVRRQTANLLFVGSIPTGASKWDNELQAVRGCEMHAVDIPVDINPWETARALSAARRPLNQGSAA